MNDPGLRRLANAVIAPGLCGDALEPWMLAELELGLGGICWFVGERPLISAEVAGVLAAVHSANPHSLVTVDEEGGAVSRLEPGASSWPGAAALGAADDVELTRSVGAGLGAMARSVGIDVVLSPVVDVNSEAHNPVIGVRSFGSDPNLVARHGAAFVDGVQSQAVAACAKHFPGHGATRVDSHLGLPTVDVDRATFERRDLAPFAAVVDAGVRALMTAHVAVPAIAPGPATLSATWMQILRKDLGFDGVVITDALDMRAIADGVGREAGAVAALRAGVDLVCVGNPQFPGGYDNEAVTGAIRSAIVAAVESGELPAPRLEVAAARNAALRRFVATTESTPVPSTVTQAAVATVTTRSVTHTGVVGRGGAPLVVLDGVTNMAAGDVESPIVVALRARDPGTTATGVVATESDVRIDDDRVVVVTSGLDGGATVDAVRRRWPVAVVVHTGPPVLAESWAPPLVVTNGLSAPTAALVAELLLPDGGR